MPKSALAKASLAPIVDELALLEKKAAAWKSDLNRIDALRALLRLACNDQPAEKECVVEGVKFTAKLGPRNNVTTVLVEELLRFVAPKVLAQVASVSLKALKDNEIAPEIIAQVAVSTQTGWRPIETIAKAGA